MKLKTLVKSLNELDLSVVRELEGGRHSITQKGVANRMLCFNVETSPDEYSGGVTFKSINAALFTEKQIKKALILVDEFLQTPIEEREIFELSVR